MNAEKMNKLIKKLDKIDGGDPETAHGEADRLIIESLPAEVREAYGRVQERAGGFWYA